MIPSRLVSGRGGFVGFFLLMHKLGFLIYKGPAGAECHLSIIGHRYLGAIGRIYAILCAPICNATFHLMKYRRVFRG